MTLQMLFGPQGEGVQGCLMVSTNEIQMIIISNNNNRSKNKIRLYGKI